MYTDANKYRGADIQTDRLIHIKADRQIERKHDNGSTLY